MFTSKDDRAAIENIIAEWNINFPLDRWWRRKHSISFNSTDHRKVSFLDMLFEYMEERMINSIKENLHSQNETVIPDTYIPDERDFLKLQEGTEGDYEDLSLDDFD